MSGAKGDSLSREIEIKGIIPGSMLDWEGMITATLFLPGCNFRCPFCQNADLVLNPERFDAVDLDDLDSFFAERRGWIDGVCLTGGEPCIQARIEDFCAWIKERGLAVKLDTNGSLPGVLERLLSSRVVDFVAMDVKAPLEPEPYRRATGCRMEGMVERIAKSIDMLKTSGVSHEFRTTIVPTLIGPEEVEEIARAVGDGENLVLQHFSPHETIDPSYSRLTPYSKEEMEKFLERARRFVPNVRLRGSPVSFKD